jgi:Fic family protein
MTNEEKSERYSVPVEPEIITDSIKRAEREVLNGFNQFKLIDKLLSEFLADNNRQLKASDLLALQREAVLLINRYAGVYRHSAIKIEGASHQPPSESMVPHHVELFCDYINQNIGRKTPFHLAAYSLWMINWIHPFTDGNGRTARAVAYLIFQVALKIRISGSPTFPELIAADKQPYYLALEKADEQYKNGKINISVMEDYLKELLTIQFIEILKKAGYNIDDVVNSKEKEKNLFERHQGLIGVTSIIVTIILAFLGWTVFR